MTTRCADCKFSALVVEDKRQTIVEILECRYEAPIRFSRRRFPKWPAVQPGDWCGKFARRSKKVTRI